MKVSFREIEKYLKILEEAPRRIARVVSGLDETLLQDKPDKKKWSVSDILAHLRSCADVWGNTIEAMLTEETQMLPDIHPRTWIRQTNYPGLAFHESLHAFIEQRAKLLMLLKDLPFEDWSRGAIIGEREHTVFTQTRRMAKHEKEHCEQIENLLQKTASK